LGKVAAGTSSPKQGLHIHLACIKRIIVRQFVVFATKQLKKRDRAVEHHKKRIISYRMQTLFYYSLSKWRETFKEKNFAAVVHAVGITTKF
jgi:radical SAM superfamily enzyme with C-terminal helix-hairpin-helix motif